MPVHIRGALCILAALAVAGCGKSEEEARQQRPQTRTNAAPGGRPFRLEFPPALGPLHLVDIKDYEKSAPGQGVGLSYLGLHGLCNLYIYDDDVGDIPDGIESPLVKTHFAEVVSQVARIGKLKTTAVRKLSDGVVTYAGPAGERKARSAVFEADLRNGGRSVSAVYLYAAGGKFIKVRMSYAGGGVQQLEQDGAAVLEDLAGFVDQLAAGLRRANDAGTGREGDTARSK